MHKQQSIFVLFLLLTVNNFINAVTQNITKILDNDNLQSNLIELLNNTKKSITVNNKTIEPAKIIRIPFIFNCKSSQVICTIEEPLEFGAKIYQILLKNFNNDDIPNISSIKIDFQTIRFIALKNPPAYDEILIYNDTPYDIFVCFMNKNIKNIDSFDCKKNGIAIASGTTFHKTVYCTSIKAGSKTKRTAGRLLFSLMNTENDKKTYSAFYHRRLYTDASLVGVAGWKKVKISAQTIKLFNEFLHVDSKQK